MYQKFHTPPLKNVSVPGAFNKGGLTKKSGRYGKIVKNLEKVKQKIAKLVKSGKIRKERRARIKKDIFTTTVT